MVDIDKLDQLDLVEDVADNTAAMDKLPSPITITEILEAQRTDDFCQTIRTKISSENSFIEGEDDVFRRIHPLEPQLRQIVLPESLRARVYHLAHHAVLAGHPGQTRTRLSRMACIRMHETLRRTYYWPSMASDIMLTVRTCPHCAKNPTTIICNEGSRCCLLYTSDAADD